MLLCYKWRSLQRPTHQVPSKSETEINRDRKSLMIRRQKQTSVCFNFTTFLLRLSLPHYRLIHWVIPVSYPSSYFSLIRAKKNKCSTMKPFIIKPFRYPSPLPRVYSTVKFPITFITFYHFLLPWHPFLRILLNLCDCLRLLTWIWLVRLFRRIFVTIIFLLPLK